MAKQSSVSFASSLQVNTRDSGRAACRLLLAGTAHMHTHHVSLLAPKARECQGHRARDEPRAARALTALPQLNSAAERRVGKTRACKHEEHKGVHEGARRPRDKIDDVLQRHTPNPYELVSTLSGH